MLTLNNLKKRLDINNDNDNYQYYSKNYSSLQHMQTRLNVRGGTDQWTRMRQDKLRSLKKALLNSYQSAIVQKYNVEIETLANNIDFIVTKLESQEDLIESENIILQDLEKQYFYLSTLEKESISYINELNNISKALRHSQPMFRCLINHDKLKVDYQDKIISIPFSQPPIGNVDSIETNFHNGTVFKWVHGNKEQWTPDTYWIVYMQYSQETAYFRAEIRKADEQIEIVTIDKEGNESTATYRGWMTGPNETTALWNTKKNVTWNDMNYTKLLYITKDQNTLAFFQRFDRVIINGKPWEVQAYNQNYSTNKTGGIDAGIIRVALKETYTSTDQFIKQALAENDEVISEDEVNGQAPYIDGPVSAKPYDILIFTAKNFNNDEEWNLNNTALAKIIKISEDGKTATVEILTGTSNKTGFYINYGNSEDTILNVKIESF